MSESFVEREKKKKKEIQVSNQCNVNVFQVLKCYCYIIKVITNALCFRPGRLEVQVEISLPDENGRLQILQIHTNKMKESSFLAPDVNLEELGM